MNLALNITFWILFGLVSSMIEGRPVLKNDFSVLVWMFALGLIPLIWWLGKVPLFSLKGFKKLTAKNWGMLLLLMGGNLGAALALKNFANFSYTTVLIIVVIGIQAYFSKIQGSK